MFHCLLTRIRIPYGRFSSGATQPKVVFPKYQIIFDQLTCVGKVCVSPPAHWHTADFPNKVSKELDQLLCVQIIFKWGLAKVCYLLARIREDFPNKVNKALVQLSCVQIFKWGLAKVSCVLDKSFVQKYRTKNFRLSSSHACRFSKEVLLRYHVYLIKVLSKNIEQRISA